MLYKYKIIRILTRAMTTRFFHYFCTQDELKMAFFLKKNLKFDIFDRVKPDFNFRDSSKIRALRSICHKFLRSGGETSLNCLQFPQIRPSLREYSAGLKTCENSRKRTRLLPKKTHSDNESEKTSPKKAKIESITKVIFRVVVRPSI